MEYAEWELAVIAQVASELDIYNRDATDMVEAQPFYMQQSWGLALDPLATAQKIINA